MRRAVFLDRDGVINRALVRESRPYPPSHLGEVEILAGVPEALKALHEAGFLLIVVTNQPDAARGITPRGTIEGINNYLASHLIIDEFLTCFHDDVDDCVCRKPKPGALLAAAQKHHIDLGSSYMIGDRWKDIEAGRRAGCKTIFVDHKYAEEQPESFDHCVRSLHEASEIILGQAYEKN